MTKHLDPIAHARNEALEEAIEQLRGLEHGASAVGYYEGWDDALDVAEQRIRALKTPEPE